MSLRARFMRCVCVYQWVGPPAAPTAVGGGAGAAPDCVKVTVFMLSTHPKVGMAVFVGVRVKAKVRALARRDAHSFLAVRAVCCIGRV